MENKEEQKSEYVTFPLWDLITPPKEGYYFVHKNQWWLCDENGNPLFFRRNDGELISQCNRNKKHMESRIDNIRFFNIRYFENILEPVKQYEIIEQRMEVRI